MEECLNYDPAVRPTIATVCERIQVSKNVYMKEYSQDVITVLQQLKQQKVEIEKLRNENGQKNNEIQQLTEKNEQMRTQMVANEYNYC